MSLFACSSANECVKQDNFFVCVVYLVYLVYLVYYYYVPVDSYFVRHYQCLLVSLVTAVVVVKSVIWYVFYFNNARDVIVGSGDFSKKKESWEDNPKRKAHAASCRPTPYH